MGSSSRESLKAEICMLVSRHAKLVQSNTDSIQVEAY